MGNATPSPQTVLIAGASGLIGSALTRHLLERGHSVHTLVRRQPAAATEHRWNPEAGTIDENIVAEADSVVNLSGASIGKIPWSAAHKKLILSSRLGATATLVSAIAQQKGSSPALIQASAVGYYGDRGEEELTETSDPGEGFLAEVTLAWEAEAAPLATTHRVAYARTGLVIARQGAMAPLRLQTLLGVAGRVGAGEQWWPWISLRDEVRALTHLVESDTARGAYNLVGPTSARSVEVTRALASLMKRPHWLGLPTVAIKALMGEAGEQLLLSSQKVIPQRLLEAGFEFVDQSVESALRQIV